MKMMLPATLLFIAAVAFAQTDTTRTPTPPPPDTTKSAAPAPATAPATSSNVKRAQFCSGVQEREPVDDLTTLSAPAERVFFFTELVGLAGKTVTHKWSLDGQSMADVAISVGSDRWRCYSTKTLSGTSAGTWKVTVVDDAGTTLAEKSLTVTAASQ
jgi:DUF2914 family protein